jgi:hypothetical protein
MEAGVFPGGVSRGSKQASTKLRRAGVHAIAATGLKASGTVDVMNLGPSHPQHPPSAPLLAHAVPIVRYWQ